MNNLVGKEIMKEISFTIASIKYRGMSLNKFKQGGERPVQQKLQYTTKRN